MIWFALYTAFLFAAGLVIGATLLRDLLDSPGPNLPPRIPLAVVLHRAEQRRLEPPAVKRRQRIRTALGWEREHLGNVGERQ